MFLQDKNHKKIMLMRELFIKIYLIKNYKFHVILWINNMNNKKILDR